MIKHLAYSAFQAVGPKQTHPKLGQVPERRHKRYRSDAENNKQLIRAMRKLGLTE